MPCDNIKRALNANNLKVNVNWFILPKACASCLSVRFCFVTSLKTLDTASVNLERDVPKVASYTLVKNAASLGYSFPIVIFPDGFKPFLVIKLYTGPLVKGLVKNSCMSLLNSILLAAFIAPSMYALAPNSKSFLPALPSLEPKNPSTNSCLLFNLTAPNPAWPL